MVKFELVAYLTQNPMPQTYPQMVSEKSAGRIWFQGTRFSWYYPSVSTLFYTEILYKGAFDFCLFIVWAKSVQQLLSWVKKNHTSSTSKISSSFGHTESLEKKKLKL